MVLQEEMEGHMSTATAPMPAADTKVVGEILEIRVDRIRRYERQPRTYFNEESLRKLAQSMNDDGQREPIEICRLDGEKNLEQPFLLVDGERRWRAKKLGGEQSTILCRLSDIKDEKELFRRSVTANLHREDMMPVDVANAIHRLAQESKMRRHAIADMFGKSPTWVDQYLSLRKLAPEVQHMLDPNLPDDQRLKITAAFQIAKVPFDDLQLKLAQESVADNLPASDVMRRVYEYSLQRNFTVPGRARKPSDEWKYVRSSLGRTKGTLDRVGKVDLEWVLLHRDDGRDKELLESQVDSLISDTEALQKRLKHIRDNIDAVHDA